MARRRPAAPRAARPGGAPPARAIYAGVLLLFGLAVGAYFVHQVAQVLLTLLVTLLLAVILSGPVNFLARRGLGRAPAMALVASAVGLLSWLVGTLMAPTIQQQARQFVASVPNLLEEIESLLARSQEVLGLDIGLDPELGNLVGMGRDALSRRRSRRRPASE